MSKTEELVKVCELLTYWGCEESMARQAAVQIVSGHPCDINDVFLSDNLVEQSEVITSFVGDYGPELLCTETLVDPMRYQRTLDAICKDISALCKHFGAEPTKSPSVEGRESGKMVMEPKPCDVIEVLEEPPFSLPHEIKGLRKDVRNLSDELRELSDAIMASHKTHC